MGIPEPIGFVGETGGGFMPDERGWIGRVKMGSFIPCTKRGVQYMKRGVDVTSYTIILGDIGLWVGVP